MNYSDPDLQDRLAADYVAGVLRGRATPVRRPAARGRRAAPAGARLGRTAAAAGPGPAAASPARACLDRHRGPHPITAGICAARPRRAPRPREWRGWSWWRTLGAGLAAAMVVLAFLVLTPSTQREGLRTLAVLSGDQAQAALVLNRLPDKSLSVQPMRDLTLLAGGRALELWAITPGLPPRSLGLVLPGQTSRLNPRLPPLPGDTVAVTLEPPGVRPPAPPPVRWCSAAPSSDRARRHQGLSQVRRAHPSARLPRISLRRPTKRRSS